MLKIGSFIVMLGALLALLLSSCNGYVQQSAEQFTPKKIEVAPFNKIELRGGFNAVITQSNESSLSIQANEENMKSIKTEVYNETLYVTLKMSSVSLKEIKLNIGINELTALKIEGGLNLNTNGKLELDELFLKVEGGANASLDLTANSINTEAKGAVNLEFNGRANDLTIKAEGASNINAGMLEAKNVSCRLAGAGNALVYPTETLYAKIEGIGKISYRGSPVITKEVDGIGLVYRK